MMLTEDLLMQAMERARESFTAACLADDPQAAHDAYHAWIELETEQQNNMREELKRLSRRMRLRKEGR